MHDIQTNNFYAFRLFIFLSVFLQGLTLGADSSAADSGIILLSEPSESVDTSSPKASVDKMDSLDGTGDEILLFTDIPIVITASRQSQPINQSSVPVSVITSDDIHYSGLTRIPEMLQFIPGVDYVPIDRNRYAVGVHGFHDMFSDRTLSLINGRIADHPLFGGAEWFSMPVLTEDIDRIEVVRGPGGAAWGANAFTGVINIITKKPEDYLGWFGSSTVTHFGDSYSHIRWGEKAGDWTWRLSVGYEDRRDSDDAGAGQIFSKSADVSMLMGTDSFKARDFSQTWRTDIQLDYQISDERSLSMGMAWDHADFGDYEYFGYYAMRNGWQDTARFFSKLNFKGDNDDNGYIQWYGNFYDSDNPALLRYCATENYLDGQYNFTVAERHHFSLGGNFGWTHVNTWSSDTPEVMVIEDAPLDEYIGGAFVIDRWETTDHLTIESQFRSDWYSETQVDWAGRVGLLYSLDDQKKHILRVAWAKAFRTPLANMRELTTDRLFLTRIGYPDYNTLSLEVPNKDLVNEDTMSVEAGYSGKLAKGLTFNIDGYQQRFNHLVGHEFYVSGPFGKVSFVPTNINDARIYGSECELALEGKPGKLSAWYAYEYFKPDVDSQSIRSFHPAKNKTGLTGRLNLPGDWTFNANYRYSTVSLGDVNTQGFDAHSVHRLDLALAKAFADKKGEIMVGVSDLLESTHDAVLPLGQLASWDIPGKTYFVRLQFKF